MVYTNHGGGGGDGGGGVCACVCVDDESIAQLVERTKEDSKPCN